MKTNKIILNLFALWSVYLFYLILVDVSAFWVSVVLTPPFGLVAYLTFKSRNLILQLFALFSFVAHAIGAPYFWMNRDNYSHSGFGSVKNFDFDLAKFFVIYIWVISLVVLIAIFTVFFDRTKFSFKKNLSHPLVPKYNSSSNSIIVNTNTQRANFGSILIVSFIVFFAVPLNIYMTFNKVGITGIMSEPLPFRLVGIMYYSRLLLIPLVLTWLYFKSSRKLWIFVVIALYSLFAGLSSAGRTVLLLSFMPLIIDVVENKQKARMVMLGIFVGVSFVLVGSSRDYTYTVLELSYFDMILVTYNMLIESSNITLMSLIGGFANRLYGAQDMILAYQYEPSAPFVAFFNYFWSGGNADTVVPDLTYNLFGLVFEEGSGFGVGLGIMSYLIILGRANIVLFPLGAVITAILLSLGYRVLTWASGYVTKNMRSPFLSFASVLLSFSIYSSTLRMYYLYIELIILFGLAMRFRHRGQV